MTLLWSLGLRRRGRLKLSTAWRDCEILPAMFETETNCTLGAFGC